MPTLTKRLRQQNGKCVRRTGRKHSTYEENKCNYYGYNRIRRNSVDKKTSNKGQKQIDDIKKSLTKFERKIIANGVIKKLEKQMNLGELDKQMEGLVIK